MDGHDPKTHVYATTVIESGAWIGAGAIVLPGVRVGRGSIVAAGSVVKTDVPPGVVVAGAPAKIVRRFGEPQRRGTRGGLHPGLSVSSDDGVLPARLAV